MPRAPTAAACLMVFVCAAGAGIHAGLVPEHLREEPRLGVAFVITTVALLLTGAAIVLRPMNRRLVWFAALMLGGLIVGYLASRTTGIPLLAPDLETVDGVGIAAVSIELLGLCCALWLAQNVGRHPRRPLLQEVPR
jgi:hypothetical protein